MTFMYYRKAKYHNKKTNLGGIVFDSKKEANRWLELQQLEKYGVISDLERQKAFELVPTLYYGKECVRGLKYIVDFYYFDKKLNSWVAEDTKGLKIDSYIVKKKVFLEKYVYEKNLVFIEGGKPVKMYKSEKKL